VPELGTEVQAAKGFSVIATANDRDRGVNDLSSALRRRFNTVVLPLPATEDEEVQIVARRVADLGRALELPDVPAAADEIRRVVRVFRELRSGDRGRPDESSRRRDLSTAEAISVMTSGIALARTSATGAEAPRHSRPARRGDQDGHRRRGVGEYLEAVVREQARQGRPTGPAARVRRATGPGRRGQSGRGKPLASGTTGRLGPVRPRRARPAEARGGPDRGPGRRPRRCSAWPTGLVPPVALLAYAPEAPWTRRSAVRGVLARWRRSPGRPRTTCPPVLRPRQPRSSSRPAAKPTQTHRDQDRGQEQGPGQPGRRGGRPGLVREDPVARLATAAGYDDPERWWEDVIESRLAGQPPFAALTEAMAELRADPPAVSPDAALLEQRREAHMRQAVRAALRDTAADSRPVAVICGAWHAPALAGPRETATADAALLRGLPRRRVALAWVPWTHARLATASGYGAGITSPGWYHHHPRAGHRALDDQGGPAAPAPAPVSSAA
jgi:hypothetical protein